MQTRHHLQRPTLASSTRLPKACAVLRIVPALCLTFTLWLLSVYEDEPGDADGGATQLYAATVPTQIVPSGDVSQQLSLSADGASAMTDIAPYCRITEHRTTRLRKSMDQNQMVLL